MNSKVLNTILLISNCIVLSKSFDLPPPLPEDIKPGCPPFCVKEFCQQNLQCENGLAKDNCGCCDVCVKKEGEACGGPHQIDGVCGDGLFCSRRHILSHRNVLIPFLQDKYGKCEPEQCENFDCGLHQWCKAVKGKPTCYCRESCGKIYLPVCGKTNGVTYQNHCYLRAEECKIQKKIDLYIGKCQACTDIKSGKTYESGQSYDTSKKCEKRICINGRFSKFIDEKCLEKQGFSCTMNSGIHNDVKCQQDKYCVIKEKSKNLEEYPDLGVCNPLSKEHCYYHGAKYEIKESFLDIHCKARCKCNGLNSYECVPLCPQETLLCGKDEIASFRKKLVQGSNVCRCPVPICIKKSDVCKMNKKVGDCFGLITRWYHDFTDGKCKKFKYGGCKGNENNFHSREACEDTCHLVEKRSDVVQPDYPAMPSPLSNLDVSGQILPLSDTDMTINGHVKMIGKDQILPKGSCIEVFFLDVTIADLPSTTLKKTTYILTDFNTAKDLFAFSMTTKKPIFSSKDVFSIKVNVFKGECSQQNLEYVTDTHHDLQLDLDENEYKVDVAANYTGEVAHSIPRDSPEDEYSPEGKVARSIPLDPPEDIPEEQFPEATVEGPKLSNKTMRVSGNIIFPFKPGRLIDSCLIIKIADVTYQDVSSVLLESKTIYFSEYDMDTLSYPYSIETMKPTDNELLQRDIAISATLNRGWCSMNKTSKGNLNDFFVDTTFRLFISPNSDEVYQDFNLICQGCEDEEKASKNVTVPFPELGNETLTVSGVLNFKDEPGMMAENSCLYLTLADITHKGLRALILFDKIIDMSNQYISKVFEYEIQTKKPIKREHYRKFDVTATLHSGWCPKSNESEWLRKGDYMSEMISPFYLNEAENVYKNQNIDGFIKIDGDDDVDKEWDRSSDEYSSVEQENKPPPTDIDENDSRSILEANVKQQNSYKPSKEPSDKSCFDETTNIRYQNGDYFERESQKDNPCTSCRCIDGKITCTPDLCPALDCLGEVFTIPGDCCASCKNRDMCYVEELRKIFTNGQKFATSDCKDCVCDSGKIKCREDSCDDKTSIPEEKMMVTTKLTCMDHNGVQRKQGATWSKDCTHCTCVNGKSLCFKIPCPKCRPNERTVNMPGSCCPICQPIEIKKKCYHETTGKIYEDGESYSFSNNCGKCVCNNGNLNCMTVICAMPKCASNDSIVKRDGVCCPVCSSQNICVANDNEKYVEGQIWQDEKCRICSCEKDGIQCRMANYSVKNCREVVRLSNHCHEICFEDFKNRTPPADDP